MDDLMPVIDFPISEKAVQLQSRVDALFGALSYEHGDELLDAAKNLLETVFRTVINDKNGSVDEGRRAATFPELYRQAKACIEFSKEEYAAEELDALCGKAIDVIGRLRNKYGASAHGRDGYHDLHITRQEALFVARISLGITNLIYGKHLASPSRHSYERLRYEDHEDFNQYIDDAEGEDVVVAGIPMRPSEVLFQTDNIAYKSTLIEYMQLQDESGSPITDHNGEVIYA